MSFLPDHGSGEGVGRDLAAALAQASDEQLETSIVALQARLDAGHAELAVRVAEYDRRRVADERHVLSTKQWLKSRLRVSSAAASMLVRFGRTLSSLPDLCDVALSGRVPVASARVVASVAERHRGAFDEHGGVLVAAAAHLSTRDLKRAVDHWEQHVAPDIAVGEVEDRFARRRISVNQTFDGMWSVSGDLDPESGHVVDTAVRALSDPGNLDPDDRRSPGQRRADAVTEVCRYWLDHNDTAVTSGGTKPHITVTIDYDRLTATTHRTETDNGIGTASDAYAEVGDSPEVGNGPDVDQGVLPEIDGTPVTAEDVRRMACDADIVRMITRGDSEILDVGRATRTVPAAIRRGVELRDGGCTWDGCDAPVSWCDAHHIDHWADGGPTSVENLRLLCRRHHRTIHQTDHHDDHDRTDRPRPPDP